MLSSLLSQLQGYFSKYFVVGSFSPMLAFTFINGAAAYFVFEPWHSWADEHLLNATVTGGAFLTTSAVVAIVLAAYVLSALNPFLRRVLEGKWSGFLVDRFIAAQNRRRLQLIGERDAAVMQGTDLEHSGEWESTLTEARLSGTKKHPARSFPAIQDDTVEAKLSELESKQKDNQIVSARDLEGLVDQLVPRLKQYNIDRSAALEQQHRRLMALIDYAGTGYYSEIVRGRHVLLQNDLNSNFGAQDTAPTKMGNIANTIQSYVMRRYNCNLEVLWSNLMQIIKKDEKAQATLMEAKTQLDFLIACCWLTLLSGAIWAAICFTIAPSRAGFLLAALGGPFVAYLWYRAAAEQYRTFADVAMTLFDMFRLDLLQAMHLPAPADVDEERVTWAALDRLMTFGQEENFRYEAKTSQQTQKH